MRYIFLIFFITLILSITSCNDWSKGKFRLTNNTPFLIDSIRLMPDNQINYFSLNPNETKSYNTDMSGPGTDGLYQVGYRINQVRKSKDLGYYTNGSSVEKIIKIYFEADTVRCEKIYSNY